MTFEFHNRPPFYRRPEFFIPIGFLALSAVFLWWVSLATPPVDSIVLQYLVHP